MADRQSDLDGDRLARPGAATSRGTMAGRRQRACVPRRIPVGSPDEKRSARAPRHRRASHVGQFTDTYLVRWQRYTERLAERGSSGQKTTLGGAGERNLGGVCEDRGTQEWRHSVASLRARAMHNNGHRLRLASGECPTRRPACCPPRCLTRHGPAER